jgi:ComF family protein
VSLAFHAVGARLRGVADALASVIFPAPCRICGETLDNASRIPICRRCLASLERMTGPACDRCGGPMVSSVPLETSAAPLCHICRRGLYDFDFARSYGVYGSAMARAIILLKYHAVFPLGGWFARRLEEVVDEAARERPEIFAADVVVPVPVHRSRLRERGYNQAELIARPLAKRLNLPFQACLLVRTKPRPDKLRLTMRERWRTVRGAYATQEGIRVDNLRVLLVDDVLTTGATLDACSRALRRAGAAQVVALTVARAVPRREMPVFNPPATEPDE